MCGRYVDVAPTAELLEDLGVEEVVGDAPGPSWNVAPTDPVRAVMRRRPHGIDDPGAPTLVQLRTVRWGLVPSWSKARSGGARMINARVETVSTKPAFKAAFARRRCLLPAAGYYEWQATGTGKVPWYLSDPDAAVLAMAGLYEIWRDPGRAEDDPERWWWTATVITRSATDALGRIHDRTPLLVPVDRRDAWLDCAERDVDAAEALLRGFPEPHLVPRRVSTAVNRVANNGPALLDEAESSPTVGPGDGQASFGL